jgi:hypothetical protein
MGRNFGVFSIAELESLDKKQRKILRDEVIRQIRESPEIRRTLKAKARRLYNRLKTEGGEGSNEP